jgi:hypothetical protein
MHLDCGGIDLDRLLPPAHSLEGLDSAGTTASKVIEKWRSETNPMPPDMHVASFVSGQRTSAVQAERVVRQVSWGSNAV